MDNHDITQAVAAAILEANRRERERRTRVVVPFIVVIGSLIVVAYLLSSASRFASPYDTVTPNEYLNWAAGILFVAGCLNIGFAVWLLTRYL